MKPTGREKQYADQIVLLKEAHLVVQKRYAYWFKISPVKKNLTLKTIMGHCFFSIKDGKPLSCFYYDSDLPGFIRDECYNAFDEILGVKKVILKMSNEMLSRFIWLNKIGLL